MRTPIDDATEQFLIAAADDLQRRLGAAADVDRVAIKTAGDAVALVVTLRVGRRVYEARGIGKDLIAAYAGLRLPSPEAVLSAAYSELMEAMSPSR